MTAPIKDIKALRSKALNDLEVTYPVPRWVEKAGVEVFVTYIPADDPTVEKIIDIAAKREKGKEKVAIKTGDLQVQVDTCKTVTFVFSDGDKKVYDGFSDSDLATDLGVESPSARNTADALFLTDGDLSALSRKVLEWSGYNSDEINEAFLGE